MSTLDTFATPAGKTSVILWISDLIHGKVKSPRSFESSTLGFWAFPTLLFVNGALPVNLIAPR